MKKIKNFFNRKNLLNIVVIGVSYAITMSLLDMYWDDIKLSNLFEQKKPIHLAFDSLFFGFLFTLLGFNYFELRKIKKQSD